MKYAVDRIENNVIVLENIKTRDIKEINKKDISFDICDGDILVYKNGHYLKDNKEKENRRKSIQDKLNRLKNLK